ncbi:hypothetical protein [Lysinibacillus xylanilyticus]|uniref:hypothetical protein n=1 Tax=Lysinibacillus xylanilyticus TaxID=582475 RepID=UPI0037F1A6A2
MPHISNHATQRNLRRKKSLHHQKKRRRKSKVERDAWLTEQEEIKANQSTYEKEIKDPLDTLRQEVPVEPSWGIKKNNNGKNTF